MGEDPKTDKPNTVNENIPEEADKDAASEKLSNSSENVTGNYSNTTIGKPTSQHTASITFVIIAAVLIASTLLTLGFFTYNAKDEPPPPAPETAEEEADEASGPVSETDVDQESAEIDQAIEELDNSEDFDEQELNDENVGL